MVAVGLELLLPLGMPAGLAGVLAVGGALREDRLRRRGTRDCAGLATAEA
jgi:hypothetical protein